VLLVLRKQIGNTVSEIRGKSQMELSKKSEYNTKQPLALAKGLYLVIEVTITKLTTMSFRPFEC